MGIIVKRCWCGNTKFNNYYNNYYECPLCHTLVSKVDITNETYVINDEDNNLYGENYWKVIMQKMTNQDSLDGIIDYYIKDRVIYWIKFILRYIPIESKIAEIGCGLGQLAYTMKSMGYKQVAYELSPQICKYINETIDIDIRCEDFKDSKDTYDAVLAFDLLEHIVEPEILLKEIYNKIGNNGVLCIQMPCYDSSLSYDEMLINKPRFKSLMIEEQHIYLYSKESISQLLRKIGFKYINFEPACFGDDYDMFLFASGNPLVRKNDEEVKQILNTINNGRLIKALITLYDEKKDLLAQINDINREREKQLNDISTLTRQIKEKDTRIEVLDNGCNERLVAIEELNSILLEKNKEIKTKDYIITKINIKISGYEISLEEKNKVINSQEMILKEKNKVIDNQKEEIKEKNNCINEYQIQQDKLNNNSVYKLLTKIKIIK